MAILQKIHVTQRNCYHHCNVDKKTKRGNENLFYIINFNNKKNSMTRYLCLLKILQFLNLDFTSKKLSKLENKNNWTFYFQKYFIFVCLSYLIEICDVL